jgi:hypothetical protein
LHDPLSETPFWRSRGFLCGVVACALISAAGVTVWLVKLNQRQQMLWRLDDDPGLSALRRDLTNQITAAKPGQVRVPLALWLGKVKEYNVSQGTDGSPPVSLLKMDSAALLAGSRSKKDGSDSVTISGKQYEFGGPLPRAGETWRVAVWRDSDENNVIHTAARARLR